MENEKNEKQNNEVCLPLSEMFSGTVERTTLSMSPTTSVTDTSSTNSRNSQYKDLSDETYLSDESIGTIENV